MCIHILYYYYIIFDTARPPDLFSYISLDVSVQCLSFLMELLISLLNRFYIRSLLNRLLYYPKTVFVQNISIISLYFL